MQRVASGGKQLRLQLAETGADTQTVSFSIVGMSDFHHVVASNIFFLQMLHIFQHFLLSFLDL